MGFLLSIFMIKLIDLRKLKVHEKVSQKRLAEVKKMIITARFFTEPIIVEKKHLVILDGHHRVKLLKEIGCKKIPAFLVNYANQKIKVKSRRPNFIVNKNSVINRALSDRLYPAKTSRHFIPWRPKTKIRLSELR